MICPNCGQNARDPILYCDHCHDERAMVDLVDPAELLRLIEKADEATNERRWYPPTDSIMWGRHETLEAIESYLTGDPEPLKKLGGMEE